MGSWNLRVGRRRPCFPQFEVESAGRGPYPYPLDISVEQIIEGALGLPAEARALPADRLAESLDPAEESRVHALWSAEAQRRLEDVRSGRVKTIPGDEALARVRRAVAQ
jgi:putative addiction module component (TIGR02574 family)